jgi:hypothetical protein
VALNRARIPAGKDIGLSAAGNGFAYSVVIEYFDSVTPGTVLWNETFQVPLGATTAQLQAQVVARGQEVRLALAAQVAAQTAVPAGTTITVP